MFVIHKSKPVFTLEINTVAVECTIKQKNKLDNKYKLNISLFFNVYH